MRATWLLIVTALALFVAPRPARAFDDGAESAARRFEAAVQAYRQGDYETAANLWKALLVEPGHGIDRSALTYDLGNAAWRRERPLEAAGWYTATVRETPRDRDAWANLELARERAGLEPADRGDLSSTLRRLVGALTLAEAEWLVLVLALALASVLVLEAFLGGALLKRSAWCGAALLVLACVPWGWRLAGQDADPAFVTAAGGASLRAEPRAEATAVGRADAGSLVERVDAVPGWVRVRAPDGGRGWVAEDELLALAWGRRATSP